jgi:hypothetical protein
MRRHLDYHKIPVLGVGFSRGADVIGFLIALVRGGWKAAFDLSFPTHAFVITEDHFQKFSTEETITGLNEDSLEEYTKNDKIVAMYYWAGWDKQDGEYTKKEWAQQYLAKIRRKRKENSRYDFIGLLSFLPVIGKYIKPSKNRQWCSENVASIHKLFGAKFITDTEIAPDQLFSLMKNSIDCNEVQGFYKI